MKTEWIFLGILIIFFIVLIIWNIIYPNTKKIESFTDNVEKSNLDNENIVDSDTEFHQVSQSPSHQLGNFLSCYFYNMGLSFLHGKNFQTKISEDGEMFTNHFPNKVIFDKSIQDEFISVGITEEILKIGLGGSQDCNSAWTVLTKEMDTFWTIMKPTVNNILKNALEKSDLNKIVDAPVIHYRCSDMPFGRFDSYHFQKYAYFKDSLDIIQKKTGKKYNKVYVCYCNSHNSPSENRQSCDKYMKSLANYLESLGYEVIEKCQSVNEDFATMFYAPGIISTISSFSFMAGYFSDGVFVSSMYNESENKHCNECGDWYLREYSLKHSQVDDYHETEKVIAMLK